jgi:ribosomal protein L7/L12
MGIFDILFGSKKEQEENTTKVFSKNELNKLLISGQKIQAIKMIREFSGAGLKEAKDFVDYFDTTGQSWELAAKNFPSIVKILENSSDSTLCEDNKTEINETEINDSYSEVFHQNQRKQIEAYIKAGQKIMAIKLFREVSGAGLKEAKDFVEYLSDVNLSWSLALEKFNYIFMKTPVPVLTEDEIGEIQEVSIGWAKLNSKYQQLFSYKQRKNIEELIKNNQNIESIKEVRTITGLGLKEAKDIIETLAQEIR